MKKVKITLVLLLLLAQLFTLCACRSVRLPDGETFSIVREPQNPGVQAEAPAAAQTEAAPSVQPADEVHTFVEQQSQEVQDLFWMVYRSILNFETRIVLPKGTTRQQVEAVDELLYIDCPELIHFSHLSTYYYMQSTPDLITEVEASYEMTPEEYEAAVPQIEEVVQSWLAAVEGMTDYEKELYVHDQLIAGCSYDNTSPHSGTLYGALVLGRARCQGYANAMTYVLRRMGVPCVYLYGQATSESGTESHAWNAVCISGVWTLVDATWDDPVGETEAISHAYFNLNQERMGASHELDPEFSLDGVPQCDSMEWNYCVQQGTFLAPEENAEERTADLLADALSQGKTRLAMQFSTKEQFDAVRNNLQQLLQVAADETGVYPQSSSYSADEKALYLEILSITYNE